MNRKTFFLAMALLVGGGQALAQPGANQKWIGVWHAEVNVQRPDTLTLAADSGRLGGTIVLDMISGEGGVPQVIERDPHVLLNPHLDGNTLWFQIQMRMRDGKAVMHTFTATLISPGKADIECLNCGADAPVVEMAKDR